MTGFFRPGPEHQRVVYLTGAGLSARAGLPTFRGEDGLWALHPDLEDAMHAEALPDSLPALWTIWSDLARTAIRHGPTPGHLAIARMGARVITQNIDTLHQVAGSDDVAELHGSALRAVCLTPTCTWSIPVTPGAGPRAEDHGVPSRCQVCGASTRPDVVLFDEMLPAEALRRAQRWTEEADLFVAVGTSGVVYPAAQLAPAARAAGATTVLVDVRPPLGSEHLFDHVIAEDAHIVLPEWERGRNGTHRNPFLDPF